MRSLLWSCTKTSVILFVLFLMLFVGTYWILSSDTNSWHYCNTVTTKFSVGINSQGKVYVLLQFQELNFQFYIFDILRASFM